MVFRTVTELSDTAMSDIVQIYLDAFPASERRPVSWLSEVMKLADFVVTIAESAGAVVGFAVTFVPTETSDAALLEYFAVEAGHRGAGVGSQLLKFAIGRVGNRPMLLEIEQIGNPPDMMRQRRQSFYSRHGCRRIEGVKYLLPIPGSPKPPMALMIANPPGELRRADLARWLATIYMRVYQCARHDPRIPIMLSTVPEIVELN